MFAKLCEETIPESRRPVQVIYVTELPGSFVEAFVPILRRQAQRACQCYVRLVKDENGRSMMLRVELASPCSLSETQLFAALHRVTLNVFGQHDPRFDHGNPGYDLSYQLDDQRYTRVALDGEVYQTDRPQTALVS